MWPNIDFKKDYNKGKFGFREEFRLQDYKVEKTELFGEGWLCKHKEINYELFAHVHDGNKSGKLKAIDKMRKQHNNIVGQIKYGKRLVEAGKVDINNFIKLQLQEESLEKECIILDIYLCAGPLPDFHNDVGKARYWEKYPHLRAPQLCNNIIHNDKLGFWKKSLFLPDAELVWNIIHEIRNYGRSLKHNHTYDSIRFLELLNSLFGLST